MKSKSVIAWKPPSMSIKWTWVIPHLFYISKFFKRWTEDRCVCIWKWIKFSGRKKEVPEKKKILRICKSLQSHLHSYKRKRRKFMVKMVPDPISPHKESWGHGKPPSSHEWYPFTHELKQVGCILLRAERIIMLLSRNKNETPDRLHLKYQEIERKRKIPKHWLLKLFTSHACIKTLNRSQEVVVHVFSIATSF